MEKKSKLNFIRILSVIMFSSVMIFIFSGINRIDASKEKHVRDIVDLSKIELLTDSKAAADRQEVANPRLESVLNRLLYKYRAEGLDAASEFAAKRKIPIENGQLHVVVEAHPSVSTLDSDLWGKTKDSEAKRASEESIDRAVSLVTAEIENLGGRVEKSRYSFMQCYIGIQSLEKLSKMPLVRSVRRALRLIPHEVVSEGVQNTGANEYHGLSPFKSTDAKVCVIDVGFEGYRDLLGTELPNSVVTSSFTDSGDIEEGEVHGTACAEIIHDMAPEADLYLANVYWDSDMIDAVNWAVEQGIDIISYSLGSYFGAGDGTGLDSALAEFAQQSGGIVWVTSAGNAADDHWSGTFYDPDGDGWHNFFGEDELLSFHVTAETSLEYGVEAYLKWNDWGTWDDYYGYSGSNQDFDLYLFIKINSEWQLVDSSTNQQPQFIWPWESIVGWSSQMDADWGIAIRKSLATQNVFFDLYIPYHYPETLEYRVSSGSLSAPADSPYVIAVGATDAVENYYHYYSSQGPTADGRIKPDLCGPSWVSTSALTYGLRATDGFAGTSASCPHVAGAIALIKGKTPFTLDEIKNILYSRIIDMGTPGMDNIYGRGRLNLRH